MNLNKSFLVYCKKNNFEINQNQVNIIDSLKNYYKDNFNKNFLKAFMVFLLTPIFLANLLELTAYIGLQYGIVVILYHFQEAIN